MDEIIEKIHPLIPDDVSVYLVGGAVRARLSGQESHDIDFAVSRNAIQLARAVANHLGVDFYPLDYEHDIGRVVITRPAGGHDMLDFSRLRSEDLEADLRERDFTINAMALDVRNPSILVDPLHGAVDLQKKQIRACAPTALQNDPVRVLRAIRLAVSLKYQIEPETRRLIREAVPQLERVSVERKRDELLKMLSGPQPMVAVRTLEIFGAFPHVFPELSALKGVTQSSPHIYDVWTHTLQVLNYLENLLDILGTLPYDPDSAGNLIAGLAVMRLGRYRQQFFAHMGTDLVDDRAWRGLLMLAALYHDTGKPAVRSVDADGRVRFLMHEKYSAEIIENLAKNLRLSVQETTRLKTITANHMRIHNLAQSETGPSRRTIYRFFRDTQEAGVDVILLSLADALATAGTTMSQDLWARYLDIARILLENWWEDPEQTVSPPKLISGTDLIAMGIQPGPNLGELLAQVREEQACGKITSREDALEFVQRMLNSLRDKNDESPNN